VLVGAMLAMASAPAAASISSDKATIKQLEAEIAAEGARIQALVSRSDQVEQRYLGLEAQLAAVRARLAVDERDQAAATVHLRQAAVAAYMDDVGASSTAISTLIQAATPAGALARAQYLDVASAALRHAIAAFVADRRRTEAEQAALGAEEQKAKATLARLTAERAAGESAIASEEATLGHVQGNLQALVAAAVEQRQLAAQRTEEEALAAAASAAHASPPVAVVAPAFSASGAPPGQSGPAGSSFGGQAQGGAGGQAQGGAGGQAQGGAGGQAQGGTGPYVNPLRAIDALSPERIDQGVDYSGYGPIYAIGDGVVLNTVNSGWPGGTFISYRLTDGPASGLVVYAAEDIEPTVSVGQTVTANTVLGQMYEGPDGIETGWADSSGQGYTMAHDYGQFDGSNSTAFGYNFSQLLQALGAPPGILQNDPPTGSLPPGWPQW
jgi:murein DD-endopeptidase MepM/ murein hydrolase activator NlpD